MNLCTKQVKLTAAIVSVLGGSTLAYADIPIRVATEAALNTALTITAEDLGIAVNTTAGLGKALTVEGNRKIEGSARYFLGLELAGSANFRALATNHKYYAKCNYSTYISGAAGLSSGGGAGLPSAVSSATLVLGQSISVELRTGTLAATPNCRIMYSGAASYSANVLVSATLTTAAPTVTFVSRYIQSPSPDLVKADTTFLLEKVQAAEVSYFSNSPVVDVTTAPPSTLFKIPATENVTATYQLGAIRYGLKYTASTVQGVGGTVSSASQLLQKATVIVSGTPIGAALTASGQTGGIFLSSASDCSTKGLSGGGGGLISSNGSTNVTFTGIAGLDLQNPTYVCFFSNKVTSIPKGDVFVNVVATTPGTNYLPNTSVINTVLTTVNKNGTTAKVYNIPSSAVADGAFIRIYNLGDKEGLVRGTLYSQGDATNLGAGDVLGTANAELGTVAVNGVLVLDVATLMEKAGIPATAPWPGRAWMQIESEITSMRVQSLIRASNGTLVNVSTVAGP